VAGAAQEEEEEEDDEEEEEEEDSDDNFRHTVLKSIAPALPYLEIHAFRLTESVYLL
jgi:hypothetical protein